MKYPDYLNTCITRGQKPLFQQLHMWPPPPLPRVCFLHFHSNEVIRSKYLPSRGRITCRSDGMNSRDLFVKQTQSARQRRYWKIWMFWCCNVDFSKPVFHSTWVYSKFVINCLVFDRWALCCKQITCLFANNYFSPRYVYVTVPGRETFIFSIRSNGHLRKEAPN